MTISSRDTISSSFYRGCLKMASRELLSVHKTVAVFDGLTEQQCLYRTSLCPNQCGHGCTTATFSIKKVLYTVFNHIFPIFTIDMLLKWFLNVHNFIPLIVSSLWKTRKIWGRKKRKTVHQHKWRCWNKRAYPWKKNSIRYLEEGRLCFIILESWLCN